uniref:Putative secreted protein n=1 Tax=Rhipicephalus microplus TaxID=6941 RepID=A0A6M2DAZ4_RHIMP
MFCFFFLIFCLLAHSVFTYGLCCRVSLATAVMFAHYILISALEEQKDKARSLLSIKRASFIDFSLKILKDTRARIPLRHDIHSSSLKLRKW